MLTAGTVVANIRIWLDGKVMTTKPFKISVGTIAGRMSAVIQQQEFGLLTAKLAEANQWRTDIDSKAEKVDLERVESRKADRVWTEMTFATMQTQFTSTFLNLQTLNSAYPAGATGAFLVLEDNGLYVWNGNKWVFNRTYNPSYMEYKDSSITQKKLADAKIDFSNQLINASLNTSSQWGFDNASNTGTNAGVLYTTPSNGAGLVNIHQLQTITSEKLYYLKASFTIGNTNVSKVRLISGSRVIATIVPNVANHTYTIDGMIDNLNANFVQLRFEIKNPGLNSTTRIGFTRPMLVDVSFLDEYASAPLATCRYILANYFDGWFEGENNLSKIALNEAISIGDSGVLSKIKGLPVFDYNVFTNPYIKSGKLITNLNQGSNNIKAFYNFVDVSEPILKMSAKVSWTGRNTAALIAQNNGMRKVSDITDSSIHVLFEPSHVYIQIFVPGTGLVDLKAVNFPMLNVTGDVVYDIGWELVDDTITVTMPHGATTTHTDARFKDVTGRYGCFEHFVNVTNAGYGDTRYHEISINDTFYDNFARFDGSLGISPSGHIYSQISRV